MLYRSTKYVYLSGPIAGQSYNGAVGWREAVSEGLAGFAQCLSPMRAKEFLAGEHAIGTHDYGILNQIASDDFIMQRDEWDTHRSDLVFVNLLDAGTRVSIGTVIEMAWAHRANVPMVIVGLDGGVHDHPMLRKTKSVKCKTLADGIEIAKGILCV